MSIHGIQELPRDIALEAISELSDSEIFETPSLTIHSGHHPKFGSVYIILSPFDDPVVLPIANQE
jgi:hypothetical protein